MIILIGAFVLFAVSLVLWRVFRKPASLGDGWFMASLNAGIVLAFVLLAFACSRMTAIGNIKRFESTQVSLIEARTNKDISALELASIQRDVIGCNQWLAESQYWAANPLTNVFYPPSVLKMKPIK